MKAVKVAVLAALRSVSAAPCEVSATMRAMSVAVRGMLATVPGMLAAVHGVLATQDTHGNSMGLEGLSGFGGLELLNNHFKTKKKSDNWHPLTLPPP